MGTPLFFVISLYRNTSSPPVDGWGGWDGVGGLAGWLGGWVAGWGGWVGWVAGWLGGWVGKGTWFRVIHLVCVGS